MKGSSAKTPFVGLFELITSRWCVYIEAGSVPQVRSFQPPTVPAVGTDFSAELIFHYSPDSFYLVRVRLLVRAAVGIKTFFSHFG